MLGYGSSWWASWFPADLTTVPWSRVPQRVSSLFLVGSSNISNHIQLAFWNQKSRKKTHHNKSTARFFPMTFFAGVLKWAFLKVNYSPMWVIKLGQWMVRNGIFSHLRTAKSCCCQRVLASRISHLREPIFCRPAAPGKWRYHVLANGVVERMT